MDESKVEVKLLWHSRWMNSLMLENDKRVKMHDNVYLFIYFRK